MKRMILTASLALALLAGGAPVANGGIYRAVQCHEPHRRRRTPTPSYQASSHRYRSSASCAGRGLGITHVSGGGANRPSGRFGAWTITAPAGTDIIRAAAQRHGLARRRSRAADPRRARRRRSRSAAHG